MATNPLYAIAADKFKADLADGDFSEMKNTHTNEAIYTLGFCRGVSYCTDFHSKKIEELQRIVADLQKQAL